MFYTKSGVGTSSGWMLLKSDNDKQNNEWAAQLVNDGEVNESTSGAVKILDVVELMRGILNRHEENRGILSQSKSNRKVVVKIDIEGMDTKVIEYMKASGLLCQVDFVYVEHRNEINTLSYELFNQGCPASIVFMDDEKYHKSNFPLSDTLDTYLSPSTHSLESS